MDHGIDLEQAYNSCDHNQRLFNGEFNFRSVSLLRFSHASNTLGSSLKDKSGVDKIIVKKQPYQLLNTNREFFPSFDASNFHQFANESS